MNSKAKDKLSYWQRKLDNMRKAKALKPQNQRSREMREEEAWRLGLERKNV